MCPLWCKLNSHHQHTLWFVLPAALFVVNLVTKSTLKIHPGDALCGCYWRILRLHYGREEGELGTQPTYACRTASCPLLDLGKKKHTVRDISDAEAASGYAGVCFFCGIKEEMTKWQFGCFRSWNADEELRPALAWVQSSRWCLCAAGAHLTTLLGLQV